MSLFIDVNGEWLKLSISRVTAGPPHALTPRSKRVGLHVITAAHVSSSYAAVLRLVYVCSLPSVLWRCWLGIRKSVRPVKNMEWWDVGMVICLQRGANDLLMVQLMPLLTRHLLLQQSAEWFILLAPAYPGFPGKKAIKRLCVCATYLQKPRKKACKSRAECMFTFSYPQVSQCCNKYSSETIIVNGWHQYSVAI